MLSYRAFNIIDEDMYLVMQLGNFYLQFFLEPPIEIGLQIYAHLSSYPSKTKSCLTHDVIFIQLNSLWNPSAILIQLRSPQNPSAILIHLRSPWNPSTILIHSSQVTIESQCHPHSHRFTKLLVPSPFTRERQNHCSNLQIITWSLKF